MRVVRATPRDYASHMAVLRRNYPVSNAVAHALSLPEARKACDEELQGGLPQDQETSGQHFHVLHQGDRKVGHLWLMEGPSKTLFLADIHILSQFRSRGFGAKAIAWTDRRA